MAEVSITINGRQYDIDCDNGQEARVVELAAYIDQKLQMIARSGAAYNDAHLMVLTLLVLTDELFDTSAALEQGGGATKGDAKAAASDDSKELIQLLDKLTKRVDGIAARVQAS